MSVYGEPKGLTRKERYAFRQMNRLCTQCGAGLQIEDCRLCVECQEIMDDARDRYEATNPKRTNRKSKRPAPAEIIAGRLRRRAEWRQIAQLGGQCVAASCKQKALDGSDYCKRHLAMMRKASREYQRRKNWHTLLGGNFRRVSVAVVKSLTEPRIKINLIRASG